MISETDRVFLEDQRTCRKQNVGSACRTRTQLKKNGMKNQIEVVLNKNKGEAGKKRRKVEIPYALILNVSLGESLHEDTCVEDEDGIDEKVGGDEGDDDEEWVPFGTPSTRQTRINCPFFVAACDRFGIGNRNVSVLTTSIIYHFLKFDRFILIKNFIYGEKIE